MKVVSAHFLCMLKELGRQPGYVVPTLIFPSLFFLFFALPEVKTKEIANILLASFTAFAVFGVVFFQFGVMTAQERESTWNQYLRCLPLNVWQFFVARCLCALFFSLLAALVVMITFLISTPVSIGTSSWLWLWISLILGSLPFTVMGLVLGYLTTARSSVAWANMIYLALSFIGGLWRPPELLPEQLKLISYYTPSRHYAELAWASVSGSIWPKDSLVILSFYFILFSVGAYVAFKKEQLKKYA